MIYVCSRNLIRLYIYNDISLTPQNGQNKLKRKIVIYFDNMTEEEEKDNCL